MSVQLLLSYKAVSSICMQDAAIGYDSSVIWQLRYPLQCDV